jgi:hypothetical protein
MNPLNNPIMHAKDAVYGSLAKCFFTIEGRRMNFLHLTDFEGTYTLNSQQVRILGKVGFGNKTSGGAGSWTATAHFNQSHLRELADHYQKTGEMPYFEIQVTNRDKTATVGSQTIVFHDCLISGDLILATFAAGDQLLTEEISGTFESWDMPQKFNDLEGL